MIAALIVTGAATAAIGLGGASGKGRAHRRVAAASASVTASSAGTLGASTGAHAGTSGASASASTHASTPGASASGGSTHAPAGTTRSATIEARDPEEARSHPAPASLHHSAASKPAVAAEAVIAPGAASNSQIEKELAQEESLERKATETASFQTIPGGDSIAGNGKIPIPSDVPAVVQRVIAGANAIADFPYVYGGGHASFVSDAYDCSGSVSYALAAGGLLSAPETSGQLESWGAPGPGKWITVYANAGHTYMYVNIGGAWMLYDTAGRSGVLTSRWQPNAVDNEGYVVRHWPGL